MRVARIAVLVVAVVLAAGLALQAAGLPAPARGDLAAAKAAEWLRGYRYATSSVELAGRTLHGRCFHGWFGGRLRRDRGTILELGAGTVTLRARHRLVATGLPAPLPPIDALLLAGCTRVLSSRLDVLAIARTATVRREQRSDRQVLALIFPRLTLLVEPTTDEPVGVELDGLRSRVHLTRLTPSIKRRLEAQR
jgi:hypothetical protein